MQTHFTADQLKEPRLAEANAILRTCVHCGFCLSTCPTYALLGDELDSPRGRIYLIKDMLENGKPATGDVVKHIDRCLSCLACMTACPSGVNYMHLIDEARIHVEETYARPLGERALRALLALLLPSPKGFRAALALARLAKPFRPLLSAFPRLAAMLDLAPEQATAPLRVGGVHIANGKRRGRVGLLAGCVQQVIDPSINAATIRLLTRLGFEVVIPESAGCCGSLTHHLGKETNARRHAQRNIRAWLGEADRGGLDAILVNASGCGTTVKDYGHMFAQHESVREDARRVSLLAKDLCEFLATVDFEAKAPERLRVAYHAACSLQHGQRLTQEPKALLRSAGFEVLDIPEGHMCCGSAGTYNILQPAIANALKEKKVDAIATVEPDVIATGNIGCMRQIASGTSTPVVHTVELLDWASGGPRPF